MSETGWQSSAFSLKRTDMPKTLIVFFSQSGNTRKCAETIRQLTGADLSELSPAVPYPRGYGRLLKETRKEAEKRAGRELEPLDFDPAVYDRLLIGCPNWWGALPSPVRTFIRKANLSSKEIAFFITHGGSGIESMKEEINALLPFSVRFLGSLSIFDDGEGRLEKRCGEWLWKIGKENSENEKNHDVCIDGGIGLHAASM